MATKTNELPLAQSVSLTDNLLVDTPTGTKILPVGRLPQALTADKLLMPGGNMSIAEYYRQYSNRNLLDNWYFPDAINQRGKTVYTGNCYTIDGWRMGQNDNNQLELKSGYIHLHLGDVGAFSQKLESPQTGKLHTFSFLTYENKLYSVSFVMPSGNNFVAPNIQVGDKTLTIFVRENGPIFHVNSSSGTSEIDLNLVAVKLELGPVQTLAHKEGDTWVLNDPQPNPALELAKCQRYFQVYPANTMLTYSAIVVAHATEWLNFIIPLSTSMRTAPSCNIPKLRTCEHDSCSGDNETYYTDITPTRMEIGKMGGNNISIAAHFSGINWDKTKLHSILLLEPLHLSSEL